MKGTEMTTVTDPEIHRVQYAFDGAFQRMLSASDGEALMAELSNLLGQVYRLRELSRSRLGTIPAASSPDLRAVMAACWVRNFDTHRVFDPSTAEDAFTDYYAAGYCVLVWKPLASLPSMTDGHGRHLDYAAELEGKPVLDTLRRGFDALAALL